MFRTGIVFDMRAPDFGTPGPAMYDAAFQMIEYADVHGIGHVNFPEHHCSEDGYVPTPMLMGAAAAARTRRIGILVGALVLPLHDPVEVAEQIAVLDLISGGRAQVVLAAGYAEREFKAFRKSVHDRSKLMDQGLDIIVRALAGERFMDGDREVFVRPLPLSKPPKILVGGGVPATARRAARLGLGMWTLDQSIVPLYEAECRKLNKTPGLIVRPSTMVHVAEDPDAAWQQIAPHVIYTAQQYAAMSSSASSSSSPWHGLNSAEAVKASGIMQVVTPQECIALAARSGPIKIHPLIGGLAPEIGWRSLELFATKVVPALA
jgi:alkanesulfonate monooxygenase SsuD/methylene tetrahydromethanopterin reductase-like flavin-dependent oxidoreductase (luciferase family)